MNAQKLKPALAAADVWGIAYKPRTHEYARYDEFAQALVEKNAVRAWQLAQKFTAPPPRHMCTSLLQILPSGHFTAHFWAPKAFQFYELMQSYRMPLNSLEYALLINLASKSRQQHRAMRFWAHANESGIVKDTNLWNQYLRASCDGDPELWPWRSRERASTGLEPERVLQLMTQNVSVNTVTLQILLAAVARRGEHRLADLPAILDAIKSLDEKTHINTYTVLVQSYAFYNRFYEGFTLAMSDLVHTKSALFWNTCLRLCIDNNVARTEFDEVWKQMHASSFAPDLGSLSMRVEYLENKNAFEDIWDMLPALRASPEKTKLAQSALQRAVTGIANTASPLLALQKLVTANQMGILTNKNMYEWLEKKGATKEQLQLFLEDDDEDTIF